MSKKAKNLEVMAARLNPESLVGVERELYDKAVDFHQSYSSLKNKYRDIFVHVRSNNITPERVDLILQAAGIDGPRASEMRLVCATDDETARRYTTGEFGFKSVLQIERAKKPGKGKSQKLGPKLRGAIYATFAKSVTKSVVGEWFGTSGKWGVLVFNLDKHGSKLTAASGVTVDISGLKVKQNESN